MLGANLHCDLEKSLVEKLSSLGSCLITKCDALEEVILTEKTIDELLPTATYYKETILQAMAELRLVVDELENIMSRKHWPYPTYGDLLFSV